MMSVLGLAILFLGFEVIQSQDDLIGVCSIQNSDQPALEASRKMIQRIMLEKQTQPDVSGCTKMTTIYFTEQKKDCAWNAKVLFSFAYTVIYSYNCQPMFYGSNNKAPNPVTITCFAGTNTNRDGTVYFPEGEEPRCVA